MFTDWFFARNKPSATKYPAYLGHTVYQEEYDKLKARLDQELKWKDELAETVRKIHEHLLPFADAGANSQKGLKFNDVTIQMAANVRDLLKASTATMKQQAREIEQLTEQLDEVTRNRTEIYNNAVAEIKELKQQLEEAHGLISRLTTTTPTNKRKPRTTGAKP